MRKYVPGVNELPALMRNRKHECRAQQSFRNEYLLLIQDKLPRAKLNAERSSC